MANDIQTLKDAPGIIAKAAAKMFKNKVTFCNTIDTEDPSIFDGVNGYNAGDTIQINKPARFIPGTSADITSAIQDIEEEKTPLVLDTLRNVPIALTSSEIVTELSLKSWMKRVLEPAVASIAEEVDKTFLEKATDGTFNAGGTPGSTTFDTATVLAANARITENACPSYEDRNLLLNPQAMASAVNARKGQFQSSTEIAEQYKKGLMGIADGFSYYESNLLNTHINGNDVTGVNVDGTVSTEGTTTLNVQGLTVTTGTVTKGSVFTIANVFAVNPITKQTLPHLQQFVVTADATADGSGDAALSVSPAIYTSASDGLQTVDSFPQDTAALVFVGNDSGTDAGGYVQNLAYHKSAFRMVSVPLVKPDGLDMAAQETVDGVTIRVIRDYDVLTDKLIMRLDFLGGLAVVRPEWAYKIYS